MLIQNVWKHNIVLFIRINDSSPKIYENLKIAGIGFDAPEF